MQQIITYPQRIGVTEYLTADLIEVDDLLERGLLNERLVRLMKEQGKIGDATPEAFKVAVARRPHGSPWPPRGFTEAYLVEKGLIEGAEAPKPLSKTKGGAKRTIVDRVNITVEAVRIGEYWLQPKKRGNFVFWDAVKDDGTLLRPKSFKSVDAGRDFLTGLSTSSATAGSPQAEQSAEGADGDHVRPDSRDSQG